MSGSYISLICNVCLIATADDPKQKKYLFCLLFSSNDLQKGSTGISLKIANPKSIDEYKMIIRI